MYSNEDVVIEERPGEDYEENENVQIGYSENPEYYQEYENQFAEQNEMVENEENPNAEEIKNIDIEMQNEEEYGPNSLIRVEEGDSVSQRIEKEIENTENYLQDQINNQ